jgi:hypothetical protein
MTNVPKFALLLAIYISCIKIYLQERILAILLPALAMHVYVFDSRSVVYKDESAWISILKVRVLAMCNHAISRVQYQVSTVFDEVLCQIHL